MIERLLKTHDSIPLQKFTRRKFYLLGVYIRVNRPLRGCKPRVNRFLRRVKPRWAAHCLVTSRLPQYWVENVPGPYDRITLPTCVFGPDGKYSQALFRVHFNYFMSTGSFTFRNTEQTINSSFIPILRDLDWTYRVIVYLDWWWPLCKQYRKQTQIISIVAGEKACRTDTLSQIVKNLK